MQSSVDTCAEDFSYCEIDLKIRQILVIVLLSLNQFIIGMISII